MAIDKNGDQAAQPGKPGKSDLDKTGKRSAPKQTRADRIRKELDEAMPIGLRAPMHVNQAARETALNRMAADMSAGFSRSANINQQAAGGLNTMSPGFSGDTSRTPLLYVDPMFDPILFLFPKDRIDEINKRLRHYYETDPIVGSALDLHASLPLADFYLECEDPEIEKYWNDFKDRSGLLEFLRCLIFDYFLLGEGIGLPIWDPNNFEFSHFNQYPPENVDIFRTYVTPTAFFMLKPDPKLQEKVQSAASVDQTLLKMMDPNYVESLRQGKSFVLGSDKKVIYLSRQTTKYRNRGVSILSRCFIPGTPVTMFDGTTKPIEDIKIGDKVITHMGRPRRVTDTPSYDVDEELLRINVDGESVTATADHDMLVYQSAECACGCGERLSLDALQIDHKFNKGHGRLWQHGKSSVATKTSVTSGSLVVRKAGDLRVGDLMVTRLSPGHTVVPENVTPGKARLFGYFLAEGSYRKAPVSGEYNGLQFAFNLEKESNNLVPDVQGLLRDEFDLGSSTYKMERLNGITVETHRNGRGSQVSGDDVRKVAEFRDVCGEYSGGKMLRSDVVYWPVELQRELMIGWLRGDGHYHGRYVEGASISERLVDQMLFIANRLGFPAVKKRKDYSDGKRKPLFRVVFLGRYTKDLIRMVWGTESYSGYEQEDAIVEAVRKLRDDGMPFYRIADWLNDPAHGFKPRGKKFYAGGVQKINDRGIYFGRAAGKLKKCAIVDGMWLRPVKSLTSVSYTGKVHCLTVDEDHSLIVSNFSAKNCLKDLLYKDKLRLLQLTFVDRHMFPIKIFKLGSESRGWIPNKRHFQKLQSLLAQASNDPDFNLIYHFGLQVDYVGTKDKIWNLIPEFDWVEKEVMAGLFINEEILHGGLPSAVRDTVSLRTLMNRYQDIRDKIERVMISHIFLPIAQARGFYRKAYKDGLKRQAKAEMHMIRVGNKNVEVPVEWIDKARGVYKVVNTRHAGLDISAYDIPRPIWKKMNLVNNIAEQQMLINLEGDGKLPLDMVYDMLGFDPKVIKSKLRSSYSTPFDPAWRQIREETAKDKNIRFQVLEGKKPDEWRIPEGKKLDVPGASGSGSGMPKKPTSIPATPTPSTPKPAKKPEAPGNPGASGTPTPSPTPAPTPGKATEVTPKPAPAAPPTNVPSPGPIGPTTQPEGK